MVNPGYPMQQSMPGGGPQPVVRRGTSKAVPVVISAGLAIGVFCGLLFGLGLDNEDASASTATATPTETKPKTDTEVPEPFQPTTKEVKPPPAATGSGSAATVAATGSGSAGSGSAGSAAPAAGSGSAATVAATGSGAGSGSAATVPPPPAKIIGRLTVTVKPDAIAKTAKIYVEGKQIDGNVFEIDLTDQLDKTKNEARKSVSVIVKASGYKDVAKAIDIVGSPASDKNENNYEVELIKRAGGISRPPPPGGNKPKCKKPPCGLIDI